MTIINYCRVSQRTIKVNIRIQRTNEIKDSYRLYVKVVSTEAIIKTPKNASYIYSLQGSSVPPVAYSLIEQTLLLLDEL